MENNRGELNHVFCLVAALGILRCLYATVKGICFLLIPEAVSLDGAEIVLSNHRALMVAVVANLLLLVSLMLTLLKNRLGVYGFAVVTFLFYTVSSAFYEDKASQLGINICLMLVQNAAFVGLLMIKRDGVRSWHLFFPKKEVAHEAETEEKQGSAKVSAGLSGLKEQADVVPSAPTFLQKQDNPLPEDKRDYQRGTDGQM